MNGTAPNPWSDYWEQQQSSAACLPAGPPAAEAILADGWAEFAKNLPAGTSLLDIACGNGAVLACMTAVNDFKAIGIDRAELPELSDENYRLTGGVDAAALPFADRTMMGIVSQFGIEYAGAKALAEVTRVAASGARLRFVMHHRDGVVLRQNMRRKHHLEAIQGSEIAEKAKKGEVDRDRCRDIMRQLWRANDNAPVVEEVAAALDFALGQPEAGRNEALHHILSGLAREITILHALENAAMDRDGLSEFCKNLTPAFSIDKPATIMLPDGQALAWLITGIRAD